MATKRKGYLTLAEHHAQLKAEGKWDEYVVRKVERDEAMQRTEEEYARAEAPLVQDLRALGLVVNSVWDLVSIKAPYAQALPILVEHLQRRYPGAVREGIARALAVPDAKFGWNVLTKLYRQEQEERVRDGLAVAIANIADEDAIKEVIDLVHDPRHGASRLLLLNALERSRDPRARKALVELETDPELKKEVKVILRRMNRVK